MYEEYKVNRDTLYTIEACLVLETNQVSMGDDLAL